MADKTTLSAPGRLALLALGVLAPSMGLAFAAANGMQNRARDTLFRCIERSQLVTLSAIMVQKGNAPCPPQMQLKVEQDSKGNRKVTTLTPLSVQGQVSVDNGRQAKFYNPDKNEMYVQPSPQQFRDDPKMRMALADENYRFSVERNGIIAGRPTWVVTATPRAIELPTRKYSIDIEKDVMLRLETVESGKKTLLFDTQAIWYPAGMDSSTFRLKPIGTYRTVVLNGPQKIENFASARALAGFEPILPKDLPFGFIVRDPHLTGKDNARFIAVRITDGLITATVYQWDSRKIKDEEMPGPNRTINGIRISLMGELPEFVHGRLLDLFAKEAARVFRANGEPPTAPATLKAVKKVRSDGGTDLVDEGSGEPDGVNSVDAALMQTVAWFLTALQTDTDL